MHGRCHFPKKTFRKSGRFFTRASSSKTLPSAARFEHERDATARQFEHQSVATAKCFEEVNGQFALPETKLEKRFQAQALAIEALIEVKLDERLTPFRAEMHERLEGVGEHLDSLTKRDEDRERENLMLAEQMNRLEVVGGATHPSRPPAGSSL